MANKRNLKKDINYLTSEILSECYAHLYLYPEKNEDKIMDIISKAVNSRNDFIAKINNPKLEDKSAKKYFNGLIEEIITNSNNLIDEIQKLNK